MTKYKILLILIGLCCGLNSPQALAVINVSNESQLISAMGQSADLNINITSSFSLSSPLTIPSNAYVFTGNGFNITSSGGGLSFPSVAKVKNLQVDGGLAQYLRNSATAGAGVNNGSGSTLSQRSQF